MKFYRFKAGMVRLSQIITDITEDKLITKGNKEINNRTKSIFINVGAGFDCETSRFKNKDTASSDNDGAVNKSFVYVWQFAVGDNVFICRDKDDLEDFLNQLDALCDIHSSAKLIVWIANLNFEFSFFKNIFRKRIVDSSISARSKTKIYKFQYGSHLVFHEALGAFGNSLEELANMYTKTKKMVGDLDHSLVRNRLTPLTDKEYQYIINDVVILSELTAVAHNMYTLRGESIPYTKTSVIRNEVIKEMTKSTNIGAFYSSNRKLIGTKEEYELFRSKLFSGGISGTNQRYRGVVINKPCKLYDITSAYMWALNQFKFPAGELVKAEDPYECFSHKHFIVKLKINKLFANCDHYILSKYKVLRIDNSSVCLVVNGRVKEASNIIIYANEVDINNLYKTYDGLDDAEVLESWYFTDSRPVNKSILDVMNRWYKRKKELKPLVQISHSSDKNYFNNCVEYQRLKDMLGSIFGICATELHSCKFKSSDSGIQKVACDWEDYNKTVFNPYYAYWTTSYVRMRICDIIEQFGDLVLQYDTDSILCIDNDELDAYIRKCNSGIQYFMLSNTHDIELGDMGSWDLQDKFVKFLGMGAKRYVCTREDSSIKLTFSGVSSDDIFAKCNTVGIDVYDFVKDIVLEDDECSKKLARRFEGQFNCEVEDYLGNKSVEYTDGGTTIEHCTFSTSFYNVAEQIFHSFDKKGFKQYGKNSD